MTSQLEDELSRTLTGAAAGAPPPGEEFLAGVRGRQRRRRNNRIIAGAACAVAITTVGAVTAVNLNTQAPAPPAYQVAAAWNGKIPDFRDARPAQEVWPDAVHRLPKTLPDGRHYQVVDALDEDRYLITTFKYVAVEGTKLVATDRKGSGRGPSVFDAKANTVRPLFDPEEGTGKDVLDYSLTKVARVGDWAVWNIAVGFRSGGSGVELWSSRLDGVGGPRRIAALTERDRMLPHPGVAGDDVYWQQSAADGTGSSGVYRLPVSGGTPQLVPGSKGFSWFDLSPWVTSAEWYTPLDESSEPRRGELLNLETGERRTWVANPRLKHLRCDPVLCHGETSDGTPAVQRLDGTGLELLPKDQEATGRAREGRFADGDVVRSDGRARYVWDRFTGEAAVTNTGLPERGFPDLEDMSFGGFENTTIQWPDGENGYYVLDLDAIR